jgi:iron complex outermembrane receptor protein
MFQYQFVASNGTGLFISRVDPAFIGDPRVPAALAQQQALDAQYGKGRYVANDPHDGDQRTHYYLVNKTTWDVTDKFQIKNIVSYTFEKDFQFPELDGTGLGILRDIPIDGVPYISKDQMSEELQFNGKAIGDALTWTVGGYWDRQQPKGKMGYGVLAFGSIINNVAGHIQSEEWAGYASAELDLSRWVLQGLKVNGGVRKTWDSSEACQSEYLSIVGTTAPVGSCVGFTDIFIGPVPAAYHKANFHKVTYEIGFSYQATPDVFLYASLRAGYRPGGFNLSSLGAASDYQQESLQEFEIGAKTNWHLGSVRGRTNIALFHDRLANAQRNVNIVIGPTVNSSVVNSATGHIQGIELENTVQLTEALQIGFNWAYTDAKYVNALSPANYLAACTVTPAQINVGFCPDNLFNNAPKNQIIGNIDYTLPLSEQVGMVSLGMNVDYRSTAALNDYSIIDPSQVVPGYARFDFYANWKEIFGSRVDLIGFVTNAFDDRSPQSTVPLLHQVNFGMGSYTYNYPRMFGFRARYTFGAE